MFRSFLISVFSLGLFASPTSLSSASDVSPEFVVTCQQRLTDSRTIPGEAPHWFFPMREIKQLSLGNFWDGSWQEVARNQSDPIPMMLEFHNALKQKGVDLLIVPIPAKATIYPEKFSAQFSPGQAPGVSPLITKLKGKGLNIIDLEQYFLAQRTRNPEQKYWCAQDAHFSPTACQEVASQVAIALRESFGIETQAGSGMTLSEVQQLDITGDLVAYSDWEKATPKERLTVQYVSDSSSNPLQPDLNSPILLLGDSHTMVFSDKSSFHCESAGLFDHLSYEMGAAVDHEGSAGGGLVSSRINLYRKVLANPGYWERKKAVVWVFTAREFTQCSFRKGFISVPIEKKG